MNLNASGIRPANMPPNYVMAPEKYNKYNLVIREYYNPKDQTTYYGQMKLIDDIYA